MDIEVNSTNPSFFFVANEADEESVAILANLKDHGLIALDEYGVCKPISEAQIGDVIIDGDSYGDPSCYQPAQKRHNPPNNFQRLFRLFNGLLELTEPGKRCRSANTPKEKAHALLKEARKKNWIEPEFAERAIKGLESGGVEVFHGSFEDRTFSLYHLLNKDYETAGGVYIPLLKEVLVNSEAHSDMCSPNAGNTLVHEMKHHCQHATGFNGTTADKEPDAYIAGHYYYLNRIGRANDTDYLLDLYTERSEKHAESSKQNAKLLQTILGGAILGDKITKWIEEGSYVPHTEAEIAAWYKLNGNEENYAVHKEKLREYFVFEDALLGLVEQLEISQPVYFDNFDFYSHTFSKPEPEIKTCAGDVFESGDKMLSCALAPASSIDDGRVDMLEMMATKTMYFSHKKITGSPSETRDYFEEILWPSLRMAYSHPRSEIYR